MSDVACITAVWDAIGARVDDIGGGVCGQSHEDGGTVQTCEVTVTLPDGTTVTLSVETEPPPPPTWDEVRPLCPDPADPQLGRNPDPRGVTGMVTYLWASPQSVLRTSGAIRGYPWTCTATPQEWTWETGDGATYRADNHGGPHPDHAAEHTYETKRDSYDLTVRVRWTRSSEYGGDTLTRHQTLPYQVVEIRSVPVEAS